MSQGLKYVPDEVLVRFKPGTSRRAMLLSHARVGGIIKREFKSVEGLQCVKLWGQTSLKSALRRYMRDPSVLYAEPNYILHALSTPNDPSFPKQWSLENTGQDGGTVGADIHATQAWNLTTGSSRVVVAVLDTGIDYTHLDLAANAWSSSAAFSQTLDGVSISCAPGSHGYNAITNTCDPMDDNGHGSHVSGTIGAVGNNGVGVTGVNWAVQVMACKWLDATGSGAASDAITCMDLVKALKDLGTNIIATNNSWGGGGFSQAMSDAIQAQQQDGILFIAAAGNDFSDNDVVPVYPADFYLPNVISVAATNRFDQLAAFSNLGRQSVHLGAPGQEILSTTPGNTYTVLSGTSMAAPHVTGVAALLAAQDSTRDWRAIKNLILAGGDPIPALAQTITGNRLDAYGSMTCSNTTISKRLQPSLDSVPATAGQPLTLAALSINCGQPAGPVQVTVSPGGETITLLDNGVAPDQASGDGIYTGQWSPPGLGNCTLAFSNGETVQATVLSNYSVGETNFSYQTITGTNLNLGDDDVATITSPFAVPFGGGAFSTLYVSSNGTLSFTNAFGDFINWGLPLNYWQLINPINLPPPAIDQPVVTLVAPLWQDLFPVKGTDQNVFWEVTGAAPNRQLVIEWRNVRTYECQADENATVTFQVVFSESSSNFSFNYSNVVFGDSCSDQDYGAAASIGMEVTQNTGTQWSLDEPAVGNNMSLLWTITPANPPPNPAPTITSLSPSSVTAGSGDTWVTISGTGLLPNSRSSVGVVEYVSSTELKVLVPSATISNLNGGSLVIDVTNPPPGGGSAGGTLTITPATPAITSLSPSGVPAGSFGFVLTINGSNFFWGTDVWWNGTAGQSTFVNSNQITFPVPGYLLTSAGNVTIQVQNAVNTFSNAVTFTITPATTPAAIAAPSSSPTAGTPNSPAVKRMNTAPLPGRFQGWKYAAQRGPDYLRQFLRRRADLAPPSPVPQSGGRADAQTPTPLPPPFGFNFRPTLPAGYFPTAVATGDFNGDGHIDWAVANAGDNNIWIYLGRGDGTSQIPTMVPLNGVSPTALAVADMNHDGKSDLVVAEADSGSVGVLLGNGDGTFGPELEFYVPGLPESVAVADFNRDGNLDVVVGLFGDQSTGQLAFLPGDGTGKLGLPVTHFGQINDSLFDTFYIAAADLNGDGLPDIVALDYSIALMGGLNLETQRSNAGARVYLNQGNGLFKDYQQFFFDISVDQEASLGTAATAVALGDVNGDGCIDAVILDTEDVATFFPGKCDGTFDVSNSRIFGSGIEAGAAALVDVNGDGKLDLVSAAFPFTTDADYPMSLGNAVSVQLGDGTGSFSAPTIFRGEPGMYSIAAADLNGDGRPDLITGNQGSDSLSVYLNDGSGGYGGPTGGYLGYLTAGQMHAVFDSPCSNFMYVDVNHDGYKDLVYLESGAQYPLPYEITVLLANGSGGFGPPIRSPILDVGNPLNVSDFTLADFRGVGLPDLVMLVGQYTPSNLNGSLYLVYSKNNGDGTFQKPILTPFSTGFYPYWFVAGDFNNDGKLDVLVWGDACTQGGVCQPPSLVPFLGNGDGTFRQGTPTNLTTGDRFGIKGMIAADVNHDGKLDLLVSGNALISASEDNAMYELIGNGDGTFQAPKLLFSNPGSTSYFATADLNKDGIPDLVEEAVNTGAGNSRTFRTYVGNSGGTFQLTGTFGPFPNAYLQALLFGAPDKPLWPLEPSIGDFNADGNIDIAVYVVGAGGSYNASEGVLTGAALPTTLAILAGNGDGTFTPSNVVFGLGDLLAPQLIGDVNGDHRADLVEIDGYTSSYDIVTAQPGPSFSLALVSSPVVGSNGELQVALAFPSSAATPVQLSASDPNISIPATVTVPAGTVSQNVSFQIGAGFNPNHVFALTGQLGSETHVVYGTQAPNAQGTGFIVVVLNPPASTPVISPSQSLSYELVVASLGGYSTQIQPSCQGLPNGAACQFGMDPIPLPPGQVLTVPVTVTTGLSTPLGTYSPTAVFTDGTFTQPIPIPFNVGDFALSISPASQVVPATGSVRYYISITGTNGYKGPLQISSRGLPSGVTGLPGGTWYTTAVPFPFDVQTQNVAPGTYQFTLTGTAGSLTHSASATLVVQGAPAFTSSIAPSSATISAGQSANFTITLSSQNGATGTVNFQCLNVPSGVTCTFNPPAPTLPANGSVSDTVTVQVNSSVVFGSYPFTVTATSGSLTSSATATLQVQGTPDFTGSITPTSATLSVGQSANFTITLNSQNGAAGTVNLQCLNVPNGTTCTFNPPAPTLPANGSVSDTLTVQVNSRPSASPPGSSAPWSFPTGRFGAFWLFVITLAAGSVLTMKMRRRRPRLAASVAILIGSALLFSTLTSCGGGGGGTSAPPPPPPVSFTITVQANGAGVATTQTIGTLTITVN